MPSAADPTEPTGPTGSTGPTVRVLGEADWALWRDLRLRSLLDSPQAFGSTYDRELAFTPDDWCRRLADPTCVSVLATVDRVPAGLAAGFPDHPGLLHVVAMWVDPRLRGRRVAASLLDALAGWAAGRGLRLHLDVATTNATARAVYERYGFVGTGETRPLREGSAELVERMVLP